MTEHINEPVAWIRKTDITELTDSEPETNGWVPLYAAPQQGVPVRVRPRAPTVSRLFQLFSSSAKYTLFRKSKSSSLHP